MVKSIKIPVKYPVISDPEILGGIPTIKGTRIPASLLFDLINRGYSIQLIRAEYPSLSKQKLSAFFTLMSGNFDVSPVQTL